LLDNNRLSHWLAGSVFSWVMMFLLFGLPIFHLWLKVPTSTIAMYMGLCCAMQLAIVPWLFSARATAQRPRGRIASRAVAVIVWSSATTLLLFLYLRRSSPNDIHTRQFTSITIIATIVFALVALIVVGILSRRNSNSAVQSRPRE
jgi:hypothetical protein